MCVEKILQGVYQYAEILENSWPGPSETDNMAYVLLALTSWCRHQGHAVPVPGDVGFREAVPSLT